MSWLTEIMDDAAAKYAAWPQWKKDAYKLQFAPERRRSMSDQQHQNPATKTPSATTALQWLKDALHDASRNTHDHGHVDWLLNRVKAGKIAIDLS